MFSKRERAVIRALQPDLSLRSRPYQAIAEETGLKEEDVLEVIKELRERGVIRRVGVVLGHRVLGYAANALVLWAAPRERVTELGRMLAALPEVTHCYHREVPEDWPYNLFTMVHARTRPACLKKIDRIAEAVGLNDYQVLISTRELKKSRINYQLQEESK